MKKLLLLAAGLLLLTAPTLAEAAKAVILFPGSGAGPNDFLLRNKSAFAGAGLAVFVAGGPGQALSIAASEQHKGDKVYLVSMSLGTVAAAAALRSGAPVDGAVFVSGMWDRVMATLGTPGKLPATLAVENPNDSCRKTPPTGAESFVRWSGGKASLRLVPETGRPVANPCTANAAHGFFHKDARAIGAIVGFVGAH